MKYLKLFESYSEGDKRYYYVQGGEGHKELIKIKTDIVESMDPPMVDVWEKLSDILLGIKEKWGKFNDKNGQNLDVVDFDKLNLNVDIGDFIDYVIAHEGDTFYRSGNVITITDRNKKEKFRNFYPDGSKKSYDGRLSVYGSSFDQMFYDFYKKNNGKVNPIYNFLIAFESEYVDNNTNRIKEMIFDLTKEADRAIKKMNARIVKLETFDNNSSKWIKIKNLSQVIYPRLSVSFVIN